MRVSPSFEPVAQLLSFRCVDCRPYEHAAGRSSAPAALARRHTSLMRAFGSSPRIGSGTLVGSPSAKPSESRARPPMACIAATRLAASTFHARADRLMTPWGRWKLVDGFEWTIAACASLYHVSRVGALGSRPEHGACHESVQLAILARRARARKVEVERGNIAEPVVEALRHEAIAVVGAVVSALLLDERDAHREDRARARCEQQQAE